MSSQTVEIPPQFQGLMGMGVPIEAYKPKTSTALNIILAIFMFLAGGGAVFYTLWLLWERIGRYHYTALLESIIGPVIGAIIAIGLGVLLLWGLYTGRKKGAVVYANGFAYSDRKGVQNWRWEQIQDITANVMRHYTNGVYTGTTHTYTLINSKGEKLVLNDALKNVEGLYNHIQSHTLQNIYNRLAGVYNSGQPVQFGPVAINKTDGIIIGKKAYPWKKVEQVAINKGILSVKKKGGGWFSGATATAGAIPNLHVLLSIIDQVVGLKTGR